MITTEQKTPDLMVIHEKKVVPYFLGLFFIFIGVMSFFLRSADTEVGSAFSFLVLMCLTGIIVVTMIVTPSVKIDKSAKILTLFYGNINSTKQIRSCSLDDIDFIFIKTGIEQYLRPAGTGIRKIKNFTAYVRTKNGEEIKLFTTDSSYGLIHFLVG